MNKDNQQNMQNLSLETLAVRAGHNRTHEGEHAEPIFATSSYVFESAAQAAARFNGDEPGNVYSRYTNPTVRIFEERIAALEGGEDAVATATGMSAILSICMALLESGDKIVCSKSVFGTTTVLLTKYMKKFGVHVEFVSLTDLTAWQNAMSANTKLLFAETPSNPLCQVADIAALKEIANMQNALLVIDNCFCTPALQKPLGLGADIIIHSATKYLDGQGRCMGGAVIANAEVIDEVRGFLRSCGPTMSPFNAWVFLKGLETLSIRMKAHSDSAQILAQWLDAHEKVETVFYAGLPSHEGHQTAKQQQSAFGGVLSFRVKANEMHARDNAWKVIDSTQFLSITANLGDTKTTICHPATTTHGRLSDEDKRDAGITENLIRVSVGLEHIEDIKQDLSRGLALI